MADSFFADRSEQSKVKAELVKKYFFAWSTVLKGAVLKRSGRLAYIDLFAGPGRYEDGSASVPVMILEEAIKDEFLRDHLVTIFNDKDENHTDTLASELEKISGLEKLKHPPTVINEEVGENVVKMFEEMELVPTLFFVDPWGYKGLSLRLINSVMKDWGCDCIFFFNYNRINPGLSNPTVVQHMNALFGDSRAEALRLKLARVSPAMRELMIIEALAEALQEMGGKYVLPFTFKKEDGTRTSHYLIFVSKNATAYKIMKEIMANASSSHDQGVPSFAYCPAEAETPLLFEFARPLTELGEILLRDFEGRSATVKQVYEEHNVGRPFLEKNYKDCLIQLEVEGKIVVKPPFEQRRKIKGKVTMAHHVEVMFPSSTAHGQ